MHRFTRREKRVSVCPCQWNPRISHNRMPWSRASWECLATPRVMSSVVILAIFLLDLERFELWCSERVLKIVCMFSDFLKVLFERENKELLLLYLAKSSLAVLRIYRWQHCTQVYHCGTRRIQGSPDGNIWIRKCRFLLSLNDFFSN